MRKIVVSALLVATLVTGSLFVAYNFWPGSEPSRAPTLAPVPPLEPVTRSSMIVAPVAIAHSAIRSALEAQAPRKFEGKQEKPTTELLNNASISWTVERGPLSVAAWDEKLIISTPLTGAAHLSGQISNTTGDLVGALGGIVNQGLGQDLQRLTGRTIGQDAGFRGNLTIRSRPALTPNWRLEPNLSGQVSITRASLTFAGVPIEVGDQVKPMLDHSIDVQMVQFQSWLRNSPFLEQAARREWAEICRSVPLNQAGSDLPKLWLEVRPTRAFAAQPRMDSTSIILTMGLQAETRVVPSETKPDCPFPPQLEILSRTELGSVKIVVPIDIRFTEINKLLEAKLSGTTFPEDQSGPVAITVQRATLTASGDRLLIFLRVKAKEAKSWLGLTDEAEIYVWGQPVLDPDQQIVHLSNMEIDVHSQAAFGLLGKTAEAVFPLLRDSLAKKTEIDLKPFAADAKKQIAAAVANFSRQEPDVRVDAAITDIRLADIRFDATTLRVIAEVHGAAKVAVSSLGP